MSRTYAAFNVELKSDLKICQSQKVLKELEMKSGII
jgi:hypothetical protein